MGRQLWWSQGPVATVEWWHQRRPINRNWSELGSCSGDGVALPHSNGFEKARRDVALVLKVVK